jgi:hypothetical protein
MEEKKKDKEKKGRERNGYASEEVEIMRAVGRWMSADGPEQEGQRHGQAKEKGENQRINVQQRQRKFRSTWGERVQEREK